MNILTINPIQVTLDFKTSEFIINPGENEKLKYYKDLEIFLNKQNVPQPSFCGFGFVCLSPDIKVVVNQIRKLNQNIKIQ